MKMNAEDFEFLNKAIQGIIDNYGEEKLVKDYEQGNFTNAYRVTDLQMRFCFDILWLAHKDVAGFKEFHLKRLYSYLNDDHIYTALKRVCPKVSKRF